MNISFEKLKQIRLRQVVYPAVSSIFLITLGIIFLNSISFISEAIDDSLAIDDQAVEQGKLKVDLITFFQIAKKLHIATPAPVPAGGTPTVNPETSPSPVVSPTPSPSPIAKSALQVAVLNSTSTGGSAGQLKAKLVQAGFTVAKTGNQTPTEPLTLIKTGPKVSDEIFDEIKAIVHEKYPSAVRQAISTLSPYDIEIVIGSK
jgi:hypothetical protein